MLNLLDSQNTWTLFLDRDGVINKKLESDYVKNWDQFVFCDGSLTALKKIAEVFSKVIIVTNQRGIGKKLMTVEQLEIIHQKMVKEINFAGGRIDKIYFCEDENDSAICRKPNIGMGLNAKVDFPEIDFAKSIMVGDSISDIQFAKNLGIKSGYISNKIELKTEEKVDSDFRFNSLLDFSQRLHLCDLGKLSLL